MGDLEEPQNKGTMGEANEFDEASLLQSFAGDEEILCIMIEKFEAQLPRYINEMIQARDASDFDSLKIQAHRIRGLSASFCAAQASEIATVLEMRLRVNDQTGLSELVAQLEARLRKLCAELKLMASNKLV